MKNKILIFKGGGYDGCFWQWNAATFEGGKLAPDKSIITGWKGKDLVESIEEDGVFNALRSLKWDSKSPFLIWDKKDWLYFCREWNSGFARNLARLLDLDMPCNKCGEVFPASEIHHSGYTGDGGIGIQFTDNKCQECFDVEHREFVASNWKYKPLGDRVKGIQESNRNGSRVSVFAARREDMPKEIYPECLYEPEYY